MKAGSSFAKQLPALFYAINQQALLNKTRIESKTPDESNTTLTVAMKWGWL